MHPFIARFSEGDNKLSLNRIFEHGLEFADSRAQAGLQLVDVVAYVVCKAILEPDHEEICAAYSLIRENLGTERDGQACASSATRPARTTSTRNATGRCCDVSEKRGLPARRSA